MKGELMHELENGHGRFTALHGRVARLAVAGTLALGCEGSIGVEDSAGTKQEPLKNVVEKTVRKFASCTEMNNLWDGVVKDQHVLFPAGCAYYGQVKFMASDVTLDCNSGSIEGADKDGNIFAKAAEPGLGIAADPHPVNPRYFQIPEDEITPPPGAPKPPPPPKVLLAGIVIGDPTPASAPARSEGPKVEDVTIRNCTVRRFYQGIRLDRQFAQVPDADDLDWDNDRTEWVTPHERTFYTGYDPSTNYNAMGDNAGYRAEYALERTPLYDRSPKRVRIIDSVVEKNGHAGIYVIAYSQYFSIEGTTVRSNGSVGIYLSHESRYTTIERSKIMFNGGGSNQQSVDYRVPRKAEVDKGGREGISIDSSAHNTLSHNEIFANYKGGIALYKNCGEGHDEGTPLAPPKPSVIRKVHADYNRIIHNEINSHFDQTGGDADSGFGIWLAMRQGQEYHADRGHSKHCRDPFFTDPGGKRRNHDYANFNTIAYNTFNTNWLAIRVSDDFNQIVGNHFYNSTSHDMRIGDEVRGSLQEPVRGTTIVKNRTWTRPIGSGAPTILFVGGSADAASFKGDMYYDRRVDSAGDQKCSPASQGLPFNDCTRPPEQLLHSIFGD